MAADPRPELRHGNLRLALAPEYGGAVAGLWLDRDDGPLALMRPLPDGAADALHAAMFPMVPFANCIRDNRFVFDGRAWQVEPNMTGARLNFHGSGWRRPWHLLRQDSASASLALEVDDGIWSYAARQDFVLDGEGLGVTISVMNTGPRTMPFGIGLHPWFPRHGQSIVRFQAEGLWSLGPEGEAHGLGPVPIAEAHDRAVPLPRRPLNRCYDGWDGQAWIDWPEKGLALSLTADPILGKLMMHVPSHDLDTFCLEPQSNAPCGFDGLAEGRLAPGVHPLAPQEIIAGSLRLVPSPRKTELSPS